MNDLAVAIQCDYTQGGHVGTEIDCTITGIDIGTWYDTETSGTGKNCYQ